MIEATFKNDHRLDGLKNKSLIKSGQSVRAGFVVDFSLKNVYDLFIIIIVYCYLQSIYIQIFPFIDLLSFWTKNHSDEPILILLFLLNYFQIKSHSEDLG